MCKNTALFFCPTKRENACYNFIVTIRRRVTEQKRYLLLAFCLVNFFIFFRKRKENPPESQPRRANKIFYSTIMNDIRSWTLRIHQTSHSLYAYVYRRRRVSRFRYRSGKLKYYKQHNCGNSRIGGYFIVFSTHE